MSPRHKKGPPLQKGSTFCYNEFPVPISLAQAVAGFSRLVFAVAFLSDAGIPAIKKRVSSGCMPAAVGKDTSPTQGQPVPRVSLARASLSAELSSGNLIPACSLIISWFLCFRLLC